MQDSQFSLAAGESKFLKFSIKPTISGYSQQKIVIRSNSTNKNSEVILVRVKVNV